MNTLEKAAAALWELERTEALAASDHWNHVSHYPTWEEANEVGKQHSRAQVQAVLDALMEPGNELIEIFYRELEKPDDPNDFHPRIHKALKAMIQAIKAGK